MFTKTIISVFSSLLSMTSVAKADLVCATRGGTLSVRPYCRTNETPVNPSVFGGTQGPQGAPGYSAVNLTPCNLAIVSDWSAYLAGSAFNDIEYCHVSVNSAGAISGYCWQYLGGGKKITITSGLISASPTGQGYQNCNVTGKLTFNNGITATVDGTMSPDKNNILGVHWNNAGGDGTFNATRLIK